MEQEFEDYLKDKKIDPEAFKVTEPETYKQFRDQFLQLHPGSFTMQKLFYINILRRKYHYVKKEDVKKETSSPRPRPVMAKAAPKKEEDKTSGKRSKPVVRPKMSKPKIGAKKTDDDEELKKPPKERPVIRPKILSAEKEEKEGTEKANSGKPKPVIKKPVVKPKAENSDKKKKQQDSPEKSDGGKAMKKPVVKPRIPKPKKKE